MNRSPTLLRRYRLLVVVYGLALVVAMWEVVGGIYEEGKAPDARSTTETRLQTLRFAEAHEALYPDLPRSGYFRGIRALFADPPDLETARKEFEQALATGIKTDEQLLYYYAVTLVMLDEEPEVVDAAIANWRLNHPRSTNLDPRVMAEQGKGSLETPHGSSRPY